MFPDRVYAGGAKLSGDYDRMPEQAWGDGAPLPGLDRLASRAQKLLNLLGETDNVLDSLNGRLFGSAPQNSVGHGSQNACAPVGQLAAIDDLFAEVERRAASVMDRAHRLAQGL